MADGEAKTCNGCRKVHIMVVTHPAQGHINPLLQFSKRLHHKGADVTFVLTKFLYNNKFAGDQPPPFAVETFSDGHDAGGFLSAVSVADYNHRLQHVGSETLRELLRRVATVDAVVYDGFMPWVLEVAKEFRAKTAAYFTQSCAVDNIYHHVHKGEIKLPLEAVEEITVAGMPVMTAADMPSFLADVESYPTFLDMMIDQYLNIEEADWVLCNSFYQLEHQVLALMEKGLRMKTVGPNIPSMYTDRRIKDDKDYGCNLFNPNHEGCRKWLDNRQKGSVVFVAFGSYAALSVEQMEELAWGLAQTNTNFLWVVRVAEEEKLPAKFAEETAERGLIVSWCAQLEVLSHQSVGCFVTHCGWNSTLEALTIGVPMVAMPQWTDQPTNAKCITDIWKTGIRAPVNADGIVPRSAVADCVLKIMDGGDRGEEIRRNAAEWGVLARMAVDHGGTSDRNVDEILAQLASNLHL